jgi:hypothetical protein
VKRKPILVALGYLFVGTLAVAQQYINPGSLAVVIVGDRKTIEQGLKSVNVGPISIRDMSGQPIQ